MLYINTAICMGSKAILASQLLISSFKILPNMILTERKLFLKLCLFETIMSVNFVINIG